MAITKTQPIKSTLKAAIDYICNLEKTDGKMLVSSYGCTAETADIEFAWMRRHTIDKGTHLGRHLIQAFGPGEVSAEVANESCYPNERKCPDREKTGSGIFSVYGRKPQSCDKIKKARNWNLWR